MTAMDAQPLSTLEPTAHLPPVMPAKPPGRFLGTLLYGRNVDRTARARTRVRLAMLGFAAVYLAIGVRLVMFAVVPESHFVRRGA
jgi:cell division protein FtsI (penicillin-binding protein 3)